MAIRRLMLVFLLLSISAAGWAQQKTDALSTQALGGVQPSTMSLVAFTARTQEPTDEEVGAMVDEVVRQLLGPKGLAALVSPGDKVIIKTNIVGPNFGKPGEKGRACITDPRVVRHIAEQVRAIIGTKGTADLKVVYATFGMSPDPSEKNNTHSFYFARLDRNGNESIDPEDICYDQNADGILDGTSNAKLVNLDALGPNERFSATFAMADLGNTEVVMPKMLRTREQAHKAAPDPKDPDHDKYCDVLIGLPLLKSHGVAGVTGAFKLHYGFRWFYERFGHSGTDAKPSPTGNKVTHPELLNDYIVAQHLVRPYDFILMDCLTGNRAGPTTPQQGEQEPVDWIPVHAMAASKDAVAIDTFEALFAGYDPASIGFLAKGNDKKIGTNDPGLIRIAGLDAFGKHRKFLYDTYHAKNLYPFRDGWGTAKVHLDIQGPANVTLSRSKKDTGKDSITFNYTAEEKAQGDMGLARLELLVNGAPAVVKTGDIPSSGSLEFPKSLLKKTNASVRLAAWDKALNCTLSPELSMDKAK